VVSDLWLVIVLDGLYVRSPDSGELVFHALAAPSAEEISDVAARTAQRVHNVFEIDVSTCQRCGGATRWLEATKPDAIARLLAKHGLGPRPPPKPPPKGQLRLAFPKP
jgi:hypothetical protein